MYGKIRNACGALACGLVLAGWSSTALAERPGARHAGAERPARDHVRVTERQREGNVRTRSDVVTFDDGRVVRRDATATRDRAAGTADREVTRTGADGRERTVQDSVQPTADGRVRDTTWTDAQGRTATRDTVVARDPEAGVRTRDTVWTGREGAVRSLESTTTRTGQGHQRQDVWTNPDGATVTRTADVVHDPASGTTTRDVDVDRQPAP